jgi:hypothetical protein
VKSSFLTVLSESKAGQQRRREAVIVEARGGVSGRRQQWGHRRLTRRRINEGGDEVRVSGCWGGVAPVTSPEYRGCWGLDRQGSRLGHGWPAGDGWGQRGRHRRVLPVEEAKECGRDRGRRPATGGANR